MLRSLVAIDAELMPLDRRFAVAQLNDAPRETTTRLYWERVHLVREWSRAKELQDPERRQGGDRRKAQS